MKIHPSVEVKLLVYVVALVAGAVGLRAVDLANGCSFGFK